MTLPTVDSTITAPMTNVTAKSQGEASRANFRNEMLEQRSNQWLGKTTLELPLSFAVYSTAALGLAALIVAYLILGSYSQTESVTAIVSPQGGIVKVLATSNGEINNIFVHEGDLVSRGTPLFRVRKSPEWTDATTQVGAKSTSSTELFDVIKAPVSGRIYALPTKTNDQIKNYQADPLATIAVADVLVVEAAVTSAVQANVKPGTSVQVELDAFKGRPQGRLNARVIAVAAEPTEDFDFTTGGKKRSYKVVMQIDFAGSAYPRDELLGKTVKVKFLLEKRKLYQWLLDPLQTLFSN